MAIKYRRTPDSAQPHPRMPLDYSPSIRIMKPILSDRMFPLTLKGLDNAMRELNR